MKTKPWRRKFRLMMNSIID